MVKLNAGAAMANDSTHDGEEWIHVISGTVHMSLDGSDAEIELSTGDSAYLRAGRRHRLRNRTREAAEVISVLS